MPGGYLITSLYAARVLVAPTRLSQALTAASCCCALCVTCRAHKVVTCSTPLKSQPARCGSLLIGSRWHRLAERLFVRAGAPADRRPCDAEMAWSLRLLPPECPLFARKFPANTSERARGTLLRCVGMSGGPPGHACGAAHRTVCVLLVSAPLVTGQPECAGMRSQAAPASCGAGRQHACLCLQPLPGGPWHAHASQSPGLPGCTARSDTSDVLRAWQQPAFSMGASYVATTERDRACLHRYVRCRGARAAGAGCAGRLPLRAGRREVRRCRAAPARAAGVRVTRAGAARPSTAPVS